MGNDRLNTLLLMLIVVIQLWEYRWSHAREHQLMDKALDKAEIAQQKVDEDLNDVRKRFIPRTEYEGDKKVQNLWRDSFNSKFNAGLIALVLILATALVAITRGGI